MLGVQLPATLRRSGETQPTAGRSLATKQLMRGNRTRETEAQKVCRQENPTGSSYTTQKRGYGKVTRVTCEPARLAANFSTRWTGWNRIAIAVRENRGGGRDQRDHQA